MGVLDTAQGGVPSVIEDTVGNVQTYQELKSVVSFQSLYIAVDRSAYSPDIGIVPVYNGMDAHELGPTMVGGIEVG